MKKLMILTAMVFFGVATISANDTTSNATDSVKHHCVMPERNTKKANTETSRICIDGQVIIKVVDKENKTVSYYNLKGQLIKVEAIY